MNCASDARLCLSDYAFPYIILVLSLVTLAVYMSASEIQVNTHNASPTAYKSRQVCLKEAVRKQRTANTYPDLCNCWSMKTL